MVSLSLLLQLLALTALVVIGVLVVKAVVGKRSQGQPEIDAKELSNLNSESSALLKRYKDAYLVAKATVTIGTTIEIVGLVLAILIIGGSFAAANHQKIAVFGIIGLIVGVFIGVLFYLLGVLVKAQGQILRATLDTAINSSPFISDEQKARALTLH